jgi:CRP-like cAMP-binding protein
MNSDDFIRLLESYHPEKRAFSNELKAFLGTALHELSYRKKYQLLNENQVPSYAWYLVKGTARVHYYDQYSQQEVTSWFWFKGELVISLNSFFRQHPSGENINLLEDSTLLRISFADMETMNRQYPGLCFIYSCHYDAEFSPLFLYPHQGQSTNYQPQDTCGISARGSCILLNEKSHPAAG